MLVFLTLISTKKSASNDLNILSKTSLGIFIYFDFTLYKSLINFTPVNFIYKTIANITVYIPRPIS